MEFRFYFLLWILMASLSPVVAQTDTPNNSTTQPNFENNNIMILWERIVSGQKESQFRSHLMFNVPPYEAQSFFQNTTPSATRYGAANMIHEASPLCLSQQHRTDNTIIASNNFEIADKVATLRELNGIFVDFRGARGPRTFSGDFGLRVHNFVLASLQESGIPVLTKEEVIQTPGSPTLAFRYSAEVAGCRPWSVSLSLKQTVVLTRDTRVFLSMPTWTTSVRQSEEDIEYSILDALHDAIKNFVADYTQANSGTTNDIQSSNN